MRNFSKENLQYLNYDTYLLRQCSSQGKLPLQANRNQNKEYIRVGCYKYRQRQIIGKGYSSKVYKCCNLNNQNKIYAIKVINLKKFKNSNLKLLENQLIIHKNLNHPNILKCLDVYKTNEYYYIITQYCADGDLYSFIKNNKRIGEYQTIQILKQILLGYNYLFQKNILHRDIKPANILKHGSTWKICDFGFAVNCKQNHLIDKYNVGTPLYMPLQSLKQNRYSIKSDIFAIGIIAFEMINGKTPWQSMNQKQLIQKLKTIKMQQPTTIKRQGKLMKFIMKACQMNQNLRLGKEAFLIFQQKYQPNFLSIKTKKLIKFKSPTNIQTSPNNCQYITYQFKSATTRNSKIRTPEQGQNGPIKNYQKYFTKNKCLEASTQVSENQSNLQYEQLFKHNSQKITAQLQTCKLIYYMIKNINYFLIVNQKTKQRLTLGLLKFLLKFIKQLQDQKINILSLRLWQKYKNSKYYYLTLKQIEHYSNKFLNQYTSFTMKIQVQALSSFNKQFRQLSTYATSLNSQFYKKYITFISQNLRILNHQIMKKYKQVGQSLLLISHHIQAIDCLYLFYIIINNKSMGRQCFLLQNVCRDYKVNNITKQKYFQLRTKLKHL